MVKYVDLVGNKIGRLQIEALMYKPGKRSRVAQFECLCDCGQRCVVTASNVATGNTKSCGCIKRELRDKNETGRLYGRLIVIDLDHIGYKNQKFWRCLCSCGKETVCSGCHLRAGEIRSCGCLRGENLKLEDGQAAFNNLLGRYRIAARQRSYCWEITDHEFYTLTQQNCFYCGQPPGQLTTTIKWQNGSFQYNGVDRFDNDLGYITGNVVPCCGICNFMKMKLHGSFFIQQSKKIAEYSKEKHGDFS